MSSVPPPAPAPTPDAALDALRAHPAWDTAQRDAVFDGLVARFAPEDLLAVTRPRLADLSGGDCEALLRIVEAFGTPADFEALARALEAQPDLAPEHAWEALAVLEPTGLIDASPTLAERYEELAALLEETDAFEELASQLDDDPDALALALQALDHVEPAERAELIGELAGQEATPGLVAFLRWLAGVGEPLTRSAALETLGQLEGAPERVARAWADLAQGNAPLDTVTVARGVLQALPAAAWVEGPNLPVPQAGPRVVEGAIGAIDAQGRGRLVIGTEASDGTAKVLVLDCDLLEGIVAVEGEALSDAEDLKAACAEFARTTETEIVRGVPDQALGLLAGTLLLPNERAPLALGLWLERVLGPAFRPRPFPALVPGDDPAGLPVETVAALSERVLDALPAWRDRSALCRELAAEVRLRGDDPRRDAGAVRLLFERRLRDRIEVYARQLLWMATFWRARGDSDLADAAAALACQLADPQHAVPGHPLLSGLATRSLAEAAEAMDTTALSRRAIDRPRP